MDEEQDLYRKTDGVLFNYKTIKAEIENLEIEIEEIRSEFDGVKAIGYEEKTAPTNAFNSSVENEIIKKEKLISKLLRDKCSKERLVRKIDNALETLEADEKEVIRLRCIERMGWNKVSAKIDKDGDYCGKIKRDAVNKLSELIWIRKKYTEK